MKNQKLQEKFYIEEEAVAVGAEERFFKVCAFDLGDAGQRKMEESAFAVRRRLQDQMEIKAAVACYDQVTLEGDKLIFDDESVSCSWFAQIPKDAVTGVFVYLLTIGHIDMEAEKTIMEELYNDIWGTAYVDAAMEVLGKEYLPTLAKQAISEGPVYLSENFGPGYYGMSMDAAQKLYGLTDGVSISVEQKTSGLLVPEKSCLGLVFVYNRPDIKTPKACEKCLGNKGGCQFCDKRTVKEWME